MCRKILILLFFSLPTLGNLLGQEFSWIPGEGPGAREHTKMWIAGNKLYINGGYSFTPLQGSVAYDMWELDLSEKKWKEIPTVGEYPEANGRGVFVKSENAYFFLGSKKTRFDQLNLNLFYKFTVVDGIGKVELLPYAPGVPTQMYLRDSMLTSLVYDEESQSFYSICNRDDCKVYKFKITDNGVSVTELEVTSESPLGRTGFAYGFDQKTKTFIMFSGQDLNQTHSSPFFKDVWSLELSDESKLTWKKHPTTLTARRNPCFAYNQTSQKLFIWGGTNDGVSALNEFHSVNLKGEAEILETSLPPRSSCSGTYNEVSKQVILGFGNTDVQFLDLLFF